MQSGESYDTICNTILASLYSRMLSAHTGGVNPPGLHYYDYRDLRLIKFIGIGNLFVRVMLQNSGESNIDIIVKPLARSPRWNAPVYVILRDSFNLAHRGHSEIHKR